MPRLPQLLEALLLALLMSAKSTISRPSGLRLIERIGSAVAEEKNELAPSASFSASVALAERPSNCLIVLVALTPQAGQSGTLSARHNPAPRPGRRSRLGSPSVPGRSGCSTSPVLAAPGARLCGDTEWSQLSGRHVASVMSRLAPMGPSALSDADQPDQHRQEGAHHNQEAVGLWSDRHNRQPRGRAGG